jgi:hypothetical protein
MGAGEARHVSDQQARDRIALDHGRECLHASILSRHGH